MRNEISKPYTESGPMFSYASEHASSSRKLRLQTDRYWFSPEYNEAFRSTSHEASKLVTQNLFDFVSLLDTDADSDRVDRGFDHDSLVVVSRDREWGQ